MTKEKKGKFRDFTDGSSDKKEYKNEVLFARVSKEGAHIYMFNNGDILNSKYESLLINKSDMENLLASKFESIKVSAMEKKDEPKSG